MIEIVTLDTCRSDYDIRDAAYATMTVGELIDKLRQYDEDAKIVFRNDNGYTYGAIGTSDIDSDTYETKEEEEERERREKEEEEREEYESTMQEVQEELTDLDSRYENDKDMTDEDYREERADIFYTYGVSEEDYKVWTSK